VIDYPEVIKYLMEEWKLQFSEEIQIPLWKPIFPHFYLHVLPRKGAFHPFIHVEKISYNEYC
jgi:hypothetical protein